MNSLMLTLMIILFQLLGLGIFVVFKKKEKLLYFTFGFIFSVLTLVIITDIYPTLYRSLYNVISPNKNIISIVISSVLGFALFYLLDKKIPLKKTDETSTKNDSASLLNLALIMIIGCFIFNIIEGTNIVIISQETFQEGINRAIRLGIYNIPISLFIIMSLYQTENNIKKIVPVIFALSLSTFLGGLCGLIIYSCNINYLFIVAISSFLTGVLLYIIMMKFLSRIIISKDLETSTFGVMAGIILIVITLFI